MEIFRNESKPINIIKRPHKTIRYTPTQVFHLFHCYKYDKWVPFLYNARYIYKQYILNGSDILPKPLERAINNNLGQLSNIKTCNLKKIPYFSLEGPDYIVIDKLETFIEDFFFAYASGKWDETIKRLRREKRFAKTMSDMPDPDTQQYTECMTDRILPFDHHMEKKEKKKKAKPVSRNFFDGGSDSDYSDDDNDDGDSGVGGKGGLVQNFALNISLKKQNKRKKRHLVDLEDSGNDESDEDDQEVDEDDNEMRPTIEELLEKIRVFLDDLKLDGKRKKSVAMAKPMSTPSFHAASLSQLDRQMDKFLNEYNEMHKIDSSLLRHDISSSFADWQKRVKPLIERLDSINLMQNEKILKKVINLEPRFKAARAKTFQQKVQKLLSEQSRVKAQLETANVSNGQINDLIGPLNDQLAQLSGSPVENQQRIQQLNVEIADMKRRLVDTEQFKSHLDDLEQKIQAQNKLADEFNSLPNPLRTMLQRFTGQENNAAENALANLKENRSVFKLRMHRSNFDHMSKYLSLRYLLAFSKLEDLFTDNFEATLKEMKTYKVASTYKNTNMHAQRVDINNFVVPDTASNTKAKEFYKMLIDSLWYTSNISFEEFITMYGCYNFPTIVNVQLPGTTEVASFIYELFDSTYTWDTYVNIEGLVELLKGRFVKSPQLIIL